MLEVRQVNHHYGRVQVLHDVDFAVNQGEILGLLGPNGAGKTTTMRILTGYLPPSSGQVLFNGASIQHSTLALRRELGYMPENVPLYPELTVREYLGWAARIKQSENPAAQVAEVMDRCGLSGHARRLIRHLSKGFRQRVGLAQAILGRASLLVLDEPTAGLDPSQIREIRALIRELGRHRTILLSTHILPEVELTCDRVLIINKGRIVAEDTPADLMHRFGGRGRYLVRLALPLEREQEAVQRYAQEPYVLSATAADHRLGGCALVVETDPNQDCRARLAAVAFHQGWDLLEFKAADVSLEEAFVNLVRDENREEAQ